MCLLPVMALHNIVCVNEVATLPTPMNLVTSCVTDNKVSTTRNLVGGARNGHMRVGDFWIGSVSNLFLDVNL